MPSGGHEFPEAGFARILQTPGDASAFRKTGRRAGVAAAQESERGAVSLFSRKSSSLAIARASVRRGQAGAVATRAAEAANHAGRSERREIEAGPVARYLARSSW